MILFILYSGTHSYCFMIGQLPLTLLLTQKLQVQVCYYSHRWDRVWIQWQWRRGRGSSRAGGRAQVFCSIDTNSNVFAWRVFLLTQPLLPTVQLHRQRAWWVDPTPRLHPSAAGKQGAIGGTPTPAASSRATAPGAGGVQAPAACREAEAYRATEGAEEAAGGGIVHFYLYLGLKLIQWLEMFLFPDIFLSSAATKTGTGDEEAARARAASPWPGREATHRRDGSTT